MTGNTDGVICEWLLTFDFLFLNLNMQKKTVRFEPIEHTADAGLKIYGQNLVLLFENAAVGLFDIITNLDVVSPVVRRTVNVEADDREALLVNWLSELNYLSQIHKELYATFFIKEIEENRLTAEISGEPVNLQKHEIYTEVKAVTYHQLYIKKTKTGWEARIIFDL